MAAKKSGKGSKAAFSLQAAVADLQSLVLVEFGLAWQPPSGAYVLVLSVQVNGSEVSGAAGGTSTSGYHVSLGKYPLGQVLRIDWTVQTFNDLNGMGAFTWTDASNAWKPLGPPKAPMAFKEIWSTSQNFTVA